MSKRVALVLGSGGARGYAHIGVIEEIERRGYDIACIAGCSMGAVVGGIYAAGKLSDYRNWIESLDYLDVLRLVDVSFRLGAIRGDKVFGQIRTSVPDTTITRFTVKLKALFHSARGRNMGRFIRETLTPTVRGWFQYFVLGASRQQLQTLDYWIRRHRTFLQMR